MKTTVNVNNNASPLARAGHLIISGENRINYNVDMRMHAI